MKWTAVVAAVLALGGAAPRFVDPEGIALDGRGGLLVADLHGQRVFRVDLARRTKAVVATTPTLAIDVAVAKGVTYVLVRCSSRTPKPAGSFASRRAACASWRACGARSR